MKNIYLGFKFAFSYFTILPVKFSQDDDLSKDGVTKSLLFFFPFVGLILGFITIVSYGMIENLEWLGLILSAVLYMILYGFLHTEAILDVADAIYAKHGGKDPYKIIKEPTVGAMGILFGIAFMILKIALIAYILKFNLLYEFVVIAIISRFALLLNIKIFDFHKSSTFIQIMKKNISLNFLILIFIIYCLIGFFLINTDIITIIISVILTSFIVVKYLKNKLGFANGDILGTSLEISELVGLFVLVYCL